MPDPLKLLKSSWAALNGIPGGKLVFSKLIAQFVPYTGSIGAKVVSLEEGRAVISLQQRRRLENHLNSIHAIALANLAELAGNMALTFTMPPGGRFIVTRIEIDYLKKARGFILAEGVADLPKVITENIDAQSHVTIRDSAGDVVVKATCYCKVGPSS